MSPDSLSETMTLPIEGAAALREILGILTDHEVEDIDGRLDALDKRLSLAWSSDAVSYTHLTLPTKRIV